MKHYSRIKAVNKQKHADGQYLPAYGNFHLFADTAGWTHAPFTCRQCFGNKYTFIHASQPEKCKMCKGNGYTKKLYRKKLFKPMIPLGIRNSFKTQKALTYIYRYDNWGFLIK